jgi:dihydrofolate reductase
LAREDGAVDWLNSFQGKLTTPFDYHDYYKTVSTVIMGRKTWEVSRSFEERPYIDKKTYVVTRSLEPHDLPDYCTRMISFNADEINTIKQETENRVWLVGGANLASQFIEMDLVDEIVQTIVPVSIGQGIPWIQSHKKESAWNLKEVYKCEMGIVQLIYQKNK